MFSVVVAFHGALAFIVQHLRRQLYRTDIGECTHQYDETQGSNTTQALSTKKFFFGCKKRDRQQKKMAAKKRTDKNE